MFCNFILKVLCSNLPQYIRLNVIIDVMTALHPRQTCASNFQVIIIHYMIIALLCPRSGVKNVQSSVQLVQLVEAVLQTVHHNKEKVRDGCGTVLKFARN